MKILLAVDASEASETAARQVAARPWPTGTTVEVLSVAEPPFIRHLPELDAGVKQRAEELARGVAERLRSGGVEAAPLVLSGDPKAVIVEHAAQMGADLVVVGPHGSAGLTRFLLGSVAKAVVRFAPCSVEVARAPREAGPHPWRVLLATDGSECSVKAARTVAARPWPSGTEVRILSVVELAVPMLQPPYPTPAVETLRSDGMKRAQDAIQEAEQMVTDAGLQVSEAVSVLLDTPKVIILDEASHWGADWIVLGSHGRRGINRFLLGSVSEAVALHATCSVEVVR
jgi:nucleotide-binding universal stress UspA family protein